MKPELQDKLVDYLGTLEEAVKTGSDFVADQAPLVVQEYLTWFFLGSGDLVRNTYDRCSVSLVPVVASPKIIPQDSKG